MLLNPNKTQLIFGIFFCTLGFFALIAKVFKIKGIFKKVELFQNIFGQKSKIGKIRKKYLSNNDQTTVILRCGAYCGEVIRRNVKGTKIIWITYDKAAEWSPDIKNFGKSPLTFYILYKPFQDAFLFPMAKVQKYFEFGKSDSLYFLALSAIKRYSR